MLLTLYSFLHALYSYYLLVSLESEGYGRYRKEIKTDVQKQTPVPHPFRSVVQEKVVSCGDPPSQGRW